MIAFISASESTRSENSRRATSSLRVESFDIGPADVGQLGRGGERAQLGGHDRQVVRYTLEQPLDRLGDGVAAGQHDPGQRGEGARLVGHQQAGQQLAAIARRDHRDVGPQPGQHVRQTHRGHDQTLRLPVQPGVGAQHQLGVDRGGLGPHGGGRQHRALRAGRRPPRRAAEPGRPGCRPAGPTPSGWRSRPPCGRGAGAARPWRPRRWTAPRRASGRGRARPAPPERRGWPRSGR